jgi:rhamnosyltransferase
MRLESNEVTNAAPETKAICALIVTYNADSGLAARVAAVTNQVGVVTIIDNGSEAASVNDLQVLAERLHVHLILNSRNEGIAAALNQGLRWADEHGYSWVFTLDQDSVVAHDTVETLRGAYEAFSDKGKLAIVASNHRDPVRPIANSVANPAHVDPWREVTAVITSGSLTSVPAYRAIGPFREEFFIDCVDFEYCLRARARGLRVIVASEALIDHSIGRATLHRLPWKVTATTNHPPIRRYYMARNHLLLAREYLRKEPSWTLSAVYSQFKSMILMCLFEKNLSRKLQFVALGVLDGLFSNLKRKLS